MLSTCKAEVARCGHVAAPRRHMQAPTWCDETSGLAFDGPTGIVGPSKIGGAYLAHAGDVKAKDPPTLYTRSSYLFFSVWD